SARSCERAVIIPCVMGISIPGGRCDQLAQQCLTRSLKAQQVLLGKLSGKASLGGTQNFAPAFFARFVVRE
ncbi:MAG: hypothetical protein ABI700_18270, partial [Chloroflexota bacterium]